MNGAANCVCMHIAWAVDSGQIHNTQQADGDGEPEGESGVVNMKMALCGNA